MKVQSTLIKEDVQGNALVELFVSAVAAPELLLSVDKGLPSQPQADSATESVLLRAAVPANHPYLPGYQSDAIKRAIAILEAAQKNIPRYQP